MSQWIDPISRAVGNWYADCEDTSATNRWGDEDTDFCAPPPAAMPWEGDQRLIPLRVFQLVFPRERCSQIPVKIAVARGALVRESALIGGASTLQMR